MEEHRDKDGIVVLPGDERIADAEPQYYTSLTPSGIEVAYSSEPRRHYKLRNTLPDAPLDDAEWMECPSVTSVLNVLEKGGLSWWGMKVGVEGVLSLVDLGVLYQESRDSCLWTNGQMAYADDVVPLLTQHKLTTNHVKDKASTRGLAVHSAFEKFCEDQNFRPDPKNYPETEQGYIKGLCAFLSDLGDVEDVEAEVMVGSLQYGYAGRYDARLTKATPQGLVTKLYPKRPSKFELVPAGRILVDVKTSRNVYPSHALQLAAYELASVECGYGETDYRAVIHLTEDGRYEFVRTHARAEDFLSVLAAHNTMQAAKGWT